MKSIQNKYPSSQIKSILNVVVVAVVVVVVVKIIDPK